MLKPFGANLIPIVHNLFTAIIIIFFSSFYDQFTRGLSCLLARPLDCSLFKSIHPINKSLHDLNSFQKYFVVPSQSLKLYTVF